MKKVILLLIILQCLASFCFALTSGGDDAATALLKEALGNMGKVDQLSRQG